MKALSISFLIAAIGLLSAPISNAQNDAEWMNIGLIMPQCFEGFDVSHTPKLETKLLSIIASNGVTAKISASRLKIGDDADMMLLANGIFCYPRFEIYDEQTVNTGMQNLTVIKCNLSLFIQSVDQGVIFSTITYKITGSGKERNQALNKAISEIDTKDSKWGVFLQQARTEIAKYYDRNCSTILEQANQLSQMNMTSEAIALLWPIPKDIACYGQAKTKLVDVYKKHINVDCAKSITKAKSLIAQDDYKTGLYLLGRIDPASTCHAEAMALISKIDAEIDKKQKDEMDTAKKEREDAKELEKVAMQSMAQVAAAHYLNKPQRMDYETIIIKKD